MNDTTDFQGSIIVGEGVLVKGSFLVPNRAVINGSLEGDLEADELQVGKNGKLIGTVKVRRADIHGETHNDLHASEHLIVRVTGSIHGQATYGLIEIERGGMIHGRVIPLRQRVGATDADHDLPVLQYAVTEPQKTIDEEV